MIILDIIVGYYLPSLWGWLFFIAVILIEGYLISWRLSNPDKQAHRRMYLSAFLANLCTSILGFFIAQFFLDNYANMGGHLFNWIPIDEYSGELRLDRTIFLFVASFVLSVVVESLINLAVLKKIVNDKKRIFGLSLFVNSVTYALGAIGLIVFAYSLV